MALPSESQTYTPPEGSTLSSPIHKSWTGIERTPTHLGPITKSAQLMGGYAINWHYEIMDFTLFDVFLFGFHSSQFGKYAILLCFFICNLLLWWLGFVKSFRYDSQAPAIY